MTDNITVADALTRKSADETNAAFLNALQFGGPDKLIWSDHWRGNQWGGELSPSAQSQRASCEHQLALKEATRERVVKRDPCAHCGVRADKHAEFGCRSLAV